MRSFNSFLVCGLLLAGCGRTPLDTFSDGDVPPPFDGGIDSGTDGGGPDCESDAMCDDGIFCNGQEVCIAGACQPGPVLECDDGVDCTIDRCSEMRRACDNLPDSTMCRPGAMCDPVTGCTDTVCTDDRDCDDGRI